MFIQPGETIPVQRLEDPIASARDIGLYIARADLLHPVVSGNKLYKLSPSIAYASKHDYSSLLSFGGRWSNHIHALAYAGRQAGIKTVGVIRGYKEQALTATLKDAQDWGMHLHFVGRAEYQQRHDPAWQAALAAQFGNAFVIPEGGSNPMAVEACGELTSDLAHDGPFDIAVLALGTGATAAGLLGNGAVIKKVMGVSVLKNDFGVRERIATYCDEHALARLWLDDAHHCGGYGKVNQELVDFLVAFHQRHAIALDPVYTGKAFMAAFSAIESGKVQAGQRVLLVHSGGLQGLRGYTQRWPQLGALIDPADTVNIP